MNVNYTANSITMQRIDISGQDVKALETAFVGLKYEKCEGLSNLGKPKNIYTESYADSDELRVYMPDTVTHEPKDITLTVIFKDTSTTSRRDTYESFVNYISVGKFRYTDNIRNVSVDVIFNEAIEITEDVFKGSIPYIEVAFKFTSVSGVMKVN